MKINIQTLLFTATTIFITGCGSSNSSSSAASQQVAIDAAVTNCEIELRRAQRAAGADSLPSTVDEINAQVERDMDRCMARAGY